MCPRDNVAIEPADDPLLGQQISSYRVTRLLGAGGMGRVYKAVQPSIGARVAIKVLAVEGNTDPSLVDRFFAEARAVNVIRHEQIVNILDLARLPDGRPYIVMEYLDGASLAAVLRQRGTLPLGAMARLAAEVLDALAAAHARAIVHRDLKPDNIWVTLSGRAKVLDFGIAKLDPGLSGAQQRTRAGSIMGTPPYMSPEQSLAKPVDLRSDLYSMGIILYECATGSVPFTAESLYEILRQHVETPPRPPRALRPDLPPAMEQVILRALAKDPVERFSDAAQMAQALLTSAATLPPDAWTELRMTTGGVALPPMPSGGIITPFGPRLPSYPTHSDAPIAHDPTVAVAPRSRTRLVVGGLLALALAGGGVATAVMLAGGKKPEPVREPAAQVQVSDQIKVATAFGSARPADPPPATEEPLPPLPSTDDDPPPAEETPPQPSGLENPSQFDAMAYLHEAQRLARTRLPDAEITQIIVQNVRPDGTADLARDGYPFVKYAFRSSSASQLGDREMGSQLECLVDVFATAYQGVKIEPRLDVECNDRIIGWPRCSLAAVWAKAIADGAPEHGIATLQWMTDFNDQVHWMFMIGTDARWIEDDCTGN